MIRPKDNPPPQWPADVSLEAFDGAWWVAHTRPRQEKSLAWDVLGSDGRYFLPMYEVTRRSRGRSWTSVLSLFPGYVFLCGGDEERLRAQKTNRIANLLEVRDQSRLVAELSAIQRLIASGLAIDPYPSLKAGTVCRICGGPLAGLEGRVERRKGRTRLVLGVTVLGQGAMVEIDASLLEPVA